jgi:parvulin-like peptidyl-prolyl isomerase
LDFTLNHEKSEGMNFLKRLALVFVIPALWAMPTRAEVVEQVAAVVNKKAIYKSDLGLFRSTLPLRAKVDPLFVGEPLAKKSSPTDQEVLDFLINEALILEKFPASDGEVEQEINGIQTNMRINRDTLRAAIRREGFRFEDYFRLMRSSLSKRMLIEREIRNKAAVSEDEIRTEYNRTHSGSKTFRGSFRLQLIRVEKKNYKTPALAREAANDALTALNKGEAFQEVASRTHVDGGSGDLGFLSYSDMQPAIQQEVRRLGSGKTGGLIEDSSSFMILKVGDVRAEADSGLDRERDSIRARLMDAEFRHQLKLWMERERSKNLVKVNLRS